MSRKLRHTSYYFIFQTPFYKQNKEGIEEIFKEYLGKVFEKDKSHLKKIVISIHNGDDIEYKICVHISHYKKLTNINRIDLFKYLIKNRIELHPNIFEKHNNKKYHIDDFLKK